MKVKVDQPSQLTAIRFFKDAAETGAHTGTVWSVDGTVLARVAFVGESASGWQQQVLPAPVALAAGVVYMVSVNANAFFVQTLGGLASEIVSGPLRSVADGTNGDFADQAGSFPNQYFGSSNYFVDLAVVDRPTPAALSVTAMSPGSGATDVAVTSQVTATFDRAIDPATLDATSFTLTGASGSVVPASIVHQSGSAAAVLTPTTQLAPGTTYTAHVSTGVRAADGGALAAPFQWSFTTVGAPTVVGRIPADAATNVAANAVVKATFSRPMDAASVTQASFTLAGPGGGVAADVWYDASTATATLTPRTPLEPSSTYTARVDATVRAADGVPLATPVTWGFSTAALPPAPPPTTTTVRINAGGPAFTTTDGRVFAADTGFTGGSTYAPGVYVAGTNDPELSYDERWGDFGYSFPVGNGLYDVTFHFVEIYYGRIVPGCEGKRVFGMDILDTAGQDITNLDICAEVGNLAALVKTIPGVAVSDGTLDIRSVYGGADDPELAAIEITPSGTSGLDVRPPTAPTLSGAASVNSAVLSWAGATDDTGVAVYNVYRSTQAGFTATFSKRIARTSATSYTDKSLAPGTYYYAVQAEDAAGNRSPASNQVTVAASADTTPPTVAVTAPAAGSTASGFATLSATASDDVAVVGVQFQLDGAPIGAEDRAAPFTISWDSSTVANGIYKITAVARDAAGNKTTSAASSVTVSNTSQAPGTGLVASYRFDEGGGTTVADGSGNGNTGHGVNVSWTTGHSGGALSFDGSSSMVTVPDSPSLALTNAMTLEAWVKPSALGALWRTVLVKTMPNDLAYALYGGAGNGRPSGHANTGGDPYVSAPSALAVGVWTHLAVTWDGTTLRLHVNGTAVASRTVRGTLPSAGALQIGGNDVWGEWFAGEIDDVRIYDRALLGAEIRTDMNQPAS